MSACDDERILMRYHSFAATGNAGIELGIASSNGKPLARVLKGDMRMYVLFSPACDSGITDVASYQSLADTRAVHCFPS